MKCPTCEQEMTKRTSYGNVEIDLCAEHGIWLDRNELMRILEGFAEENRRPPDVGGGESRQRGRFEGIFLGWLSLLLPK